MITSLLLSFVLQNSDPTTFRLWIVGDPHVREGENSLLEATQDIEDLGGFDMAAVVGDLIGEQACPDLQNQEHFEQQFTNNREKFYILAGNHDGDPGMLWFKTVIDPMGVSPFSIVNNEKRPYPIIGNAMRYRVNVGNLSMLFLSDDNGVFPPEGRSCDVLGGHPAGYVSREAYEWWMSQLGEDKLYITFSHQGLLETTAYTGISEGWEQGIHGASSQFDEMGSSIIYSIGGVLVTNRHWGFKGYLQAFPAATHAWFHGHTHLTVHPGTVFNGRSLQEVVHGTLFVNTGTVTYNQGPVQARFSRLLIFKAGSDLVRMHTILHDDWNGFSKGIHKTNVFNLGEPFILK